MNRPATIALSVLALALTSANADAAGMMLRRPLVTDIAPRPMNIDPTIAKIRPHLTPWGAQWAHTEAQRLSSGKISPDAISGDAQSACGQNNCFDLANMPIEDAMIMMMMLINNDAEQDMRDQLADMQRIQQEKQAQRSANEQMRAEQQSMRQKMEDEQASKDSLDDIGQEDQLELQMLTERHRRAMQALSEAKKKIDDTNDSIIKNLK